MAATKGRSRSAPDLFAPTPAPSFAGQLSHISEYEQMMDTLQGTIIWLFNF